MSQDKIVVTNQPPLPARCVVCYNDAKSNLNYVDFGMSLDDYGAILICELCMISAAKAVGYEPVKPEDPMKLIQAAEIVSLKQKVRALESLVRVYAGDDSLDLGSLFGPSADLSLFEGLEAGSNQISTV